MYSHWIMDIRGATDIAVRSKKLALKTGDPDDMALAEAMLAASDHLLGNHLAAQLHCESGLRYLASGPRSSNRTVSFSLYELLARRHGTFSPVQRLARPIARLCKARQRGRQKVRSPRHVLPISGLGPSCLSDHGGPEAIG